MKKIVIASRNQGKIKEFKNILSEFEILSLLDFPSIPEIEETGDSFVENAIIKANTVYNYTKIDTVADDSGLEVDFLDRKPGVHSSRFLGENASDLERNKEILRLLKDVPDNKRTARFICELAFKSKLVTKVFSGVVEGKVALEIKGSEGFGYDPVFIPQGYDRTFGELGKEIKDKISHRAEAIKKLSFWLKGLEKTDKKY